MDSGAQKDTLPSAAVSALAHGNKIEAIKIIRLERKSSLLEAKQEVEKFLATNPRALAQYEQSQRQVKTQFRGMGWISGVAVLAGALLIYALR